MKVNEVQREAIKSFLSYIDEFDLMSLSRTVTNNLVSIKNINDAVQAILQHEVDMKSLLSRRKVTKEVLFKYLHDNMIDVPTNCEKNFFVSKVLEIWNENFVVQVPSSSTSTSASKQQAECATPNIEHIGDVNKLAEKFASWFYSILNNCVLTQQTDKLSIEHFWNDCSLHLIMESASESVVQNVHRNANDVVNLLREILKQHRLYFNPNISHSGVRGKVDPHGLVVVMVCGTLHQVDTCVGVFKQLFGLLRDPFMENNWRIKSSSILLKSIDSSQVQSIDYERLNLALPE